MFSRTSLIVLIWAACLHAAPLPSRVFLSDARLSLEIPSGWTTVDSGDLDPLFVRETPEGAEAMIGFRLFPIRDAAAFSSTIDPEALKAFAINDAASQIGKGRILTQGTRLFAERPAYEMTWETPKTEGLEQTQALYVFAENRFAVLLLRARRESFAWLVPEFQKWLESARSLSRRGSGSLDSPSHGGVWAHVGGGARVRFPEDWLIGVADDRMVGAAFAHEERHLTFTLSMEPGAFPAGMPAEAAMPLAKELIEKKGFRVTEAAHEPFHGLPALELSYEGSPGSRLLKGHDIWVFGRQSRWLINIEGDSKLYRARWNDFRDILSAIDFL